MLSLALMTMSMSLSMDAQEVEPDCAGNTLEMTACVQAAADEAQVQMDRYYQAAIDRLLSPDFSDSEAGRRTAIHLAYAQRLFAQHRSAECSARYEFFGAGSIRGIEAAACRLDLTNARTHDLWERWLTYPDGTPPILPRPEPIGFD